MSETVTARKKTITLEERLEKIKMKQEQLENQKRALMKSRKEKERKQRTRDLIQGGAIMGAFFDTNNPDRFLFQAFAERIRDTDFMNNNLYYIEKRAYDLRQESSDKPTSQSK